MPLLLVPCEPGAPRRPDPQFAPEAVAARALGFDTALIDHDVLEASADGGAALARARLPSAGRGWVYRGWMMRVAGYAALADAMTERGFEALTAAEAYRLTHHGPENAALLAPWSAANVAVPLEGLSDAALVRALASFGDGPVIVKDWVKSQAAGYWREACFIPHASDTARALGVIARFRELQGEFLVGGIVLKAYHPLMGEEASGQDRATEWRSFVVDGVPALTVARDAGGSALAAPPAPLLEAVARAVPARFFTMDWGLRQDGAHLLLEIGDGGVSGLPDGVDPAPLFSALKLALA